MTLTVPTTPLLCMRTEVGHFLGIYHAVETRNSLDNKTGYDHR